MLGSLLEGAKATIRRAGALDRSFENSSDGKGAGTTSSNNVNNEESRSVSNVEPKPSLQEQDLPKPATASPAAGGPSPSPSSATSESGSAYSVSRSFSLFRASSAASVTRVIQPVKKALGGDPEAIQTRAVLTKYRAQLSAAVADAAARAAKSREERDLLTGALAGQEDNLRCWGYLTLLPSFREHRRRETIRAQLRLGHSELQEKVLSAKLQDVVRMLRSMSFIGSWKPQGSIPEEGHEFPRGSGLQAPGGKGDAGQGHGGGDGGGGSSRLDLKGFVVDPADLLAGDAALASVQQQLVTCDRACAVAADAFARKVVDAGGLQPRTPEDRAQTLLSLLCRYHVLVETMAGAGAAEVATTAAAVAAAAESKRSRQATEEERQSREERLSWEERQSREDRQSREERQCKEKRQSTEERQSTAERPSTEQRQSRDEDVPEMTVVEGRQSAEEGVPATAVIEAAKVVGQAAVANTVPSSEWGRCSGSETGGHTDDNEIIMPCSGGGGATTTTSIIPSPSSISAPSLPPPDRVTTTSTIEELQDIAGVSSGGCITPADLKQGEDNEITDVGFLKEGKKGCEEIFFELMLDERTREGRLLRRFLTMAQARKSPPLSASSSFSSPPPPAKSVRVASFAAATAASVVCSLSSMGRGDGGNASTDASTDADPKANANAKPDANALKANKIGSGKPSDKAVVGVASAGATVGVSNRATGQEEWDGDGAVGPQVVRAFINYFSKEFDVPDILVPSLTELVALLVFRKARRLVFGYDKRSVMQRDQAWREKASAMRSVPLLQLGVPPEYIPAGPLHASSQANLTTTAEAGETTKEPTLRGLSGKAPVQGPCVNSAKSPARRVGGGGVSHADEGTGAEARVGTGAGTGAGAGAGVEEEMGAETGGEIVPESKLEADREADMISETDSVTESVDMESEMELVWDSVTEAETDSATEAESESDTESATEAEIDSVTPAKNQAEAKPGTKAETNAQAQVKTEAGAGAGARGGAADVEADVLEKAESETILEAEVGVDAGTRAEGEAEVAAGMAGAATLSSATVAAPEVVGTVAGSAEGETPELHVEGGERTTPLSRRPGEGAGDVSGGVARSERRNDGSPTGGTLTTETAVVRRTKGTNGDGPVESGGRFGRLGDCLTPSEMVAVVKAGMASLAEDAARISGSDKPLDADTLIPLLVHVLVHATLPRVHEALNFLRNFRGASWGGEPAYYVTCIEGAVSFVLDWTPEDTRTANDRSPRGTLSGLTPVHGINGRNVFFCDKPPAKGAHAGGHGGEGGSRDGREGSRVSEEVERERGREALTRLGIFLEKHEVQEDTVDVLSSAGWL
eukprot:jgi/Undpi1/9731/HiC_scaffold_27.g12187.m1